MPWTVEDLLRDVEPDACSCGADLVEYGVGGEDVLACDEGCDDGALDALYSIPRRQVEANPRLRRWDIATGEFVPEEGPNVGKSAPESPRPSPAWMKDVPDLERRLHGTVRRWLFTRGPAVVWTTDERRGEAWRADGAPSLVLHPGADVEAVAWYACYRRLHRVGLDVGCGEDWDVAAIEAALRKYEYLGVVPNVVTCVMSHEGVETTIDAGGSLGGLYYEAADLMKENLPPLRWAVPNFLPAGLAILAGRPKRGKSVLALQLALAKAQGTDYLMPNDPLTRSKVLYLALEDSPRRLQKRIRDMHGNGPLPLGLLLVDGLRPWPVRDSKRGEETLRRVLDGNPGVEVVIIDTLEKFRTPLRTAPGAGGYGEDYDGLASLKLIADERNIVITLIHHTRKTLANAEPTFDDVLGSTALTGAPDTIWLFSRPDEELRGKLAIGGRDVEETTLALVGESMRWRVAEETDAGGSQGLDEAARVLIYEALCKEKYLTQAEILAAWPDVAMGVAPPSAATVARDLKKVPSKFDCQGDGTKNSPRRYKHIV